MRVRKSVAVLVAAACVVGGPTVLFWLRRPPLDLTLASIEPADIFDDDGVEMWLATLSLSNHSAVPLVIEDKSTEVQARVGKQWVPGLEPSQFTGLGPRRAAEMLVLLPHGAQSLQLQLRYDKAFPLSRRVTDWLARVFPRLYRNRLFGSALVRYYYNVRFNPPRHWRPLVTPELVLPERISRVPQVTNQGQPNGQK